MKKKNKGVKFVRIRGRIVPIKIKNEVKTAKEFGSSKNRGSIAQLAGAGALGASGLYGAGRLHKKALEIGSSKLNRVAKLSKFGIAFGVGAIASNAWAKIDKKTGDERSKLLSIGSQAKTAAGHVASFGLAYGSYRLGKRFEYAGKLGKNLFTKAGIKSMKNLKAI